jgi:hypothetical protein
MRSEESTAHRPSVKHYEETHRTGSTVFGPADDVSGVDFDLMEGLSR